MAKFPIAHLVYFGLILSIVTPISLAIDTLQNDVTIVPAPSFIRITIGGVELQNSTISVNSTIKIEYRADRTSVEGVLLLGEGSGLSLTVGQGESFLFTKDLSEKEFSYYSFEFNVSEYTKFYAWSWSQTIFNGTAETFDNLNPDPSGNQYHYLWITGQASYPKLLNLSVNGKNLIDGVAPSNSTVLINYTVFDPNNASDRDASISFADNSSNVYNSVPVSLNWTSWNSASKLHNFYTTYTLQTRIIFFSASNNRGFERNSSSEPKVNTISSNNFVFNATYLELTQTSLSDIDMFVTNITAYNQTKDDVFFARYSINDNQNIDNIPWVDIQLQTFEGSKIRNMTLSNTTETVYPFTLNETLIIGQTFYFQAYVKYFNLTQYLSTHAFTIFDSRPSTQFLTEELTITNQNDVTVDFIVTNQKGTLTSASLNTGINATGFNNSINILTKDSLDTGANQTLTFSGEGIFSVSINATNSFDRTSNSLIYIQTDYTKPSAIFVVNSATSNFQAGYVELDASFFDVGSTNSGVATAHLNWGNNLIEDIFSQNSISHNYTQNGEYILVLTVSDKAGNVENFTLTIQIALLTTSTNVPSGLNSAIYLTFFSIVIITVFQFAKKRKLRLVH